MATSSQKFIARNRAPRVQIEYDVELHGAEKKVQLPFVMGVMADLATAGIRKRLETVQIAGRVDAQQILARGRRGGVLVQFAHQPADAQQIDQPALAFRAFGQAGAGLDQTAHRQGQRVIATAMPQRPFVVKKAGCH